MQIRLAMLAVVTASLGLLATIAQAQVAQEPGYVLDYNLNIKAATTGGFSSNGVPYTTDNSGSIATGSFNRVAYELTLSGSSNPHSPNGNVWVSFDTQSPNASKLGVPTTGSGEFYQQSVSNMNVIATAGSGVTNATGLTNGNIQFWPSNYAPNGATGNFDWNNQGANGSQGYGALQISQITNTSGSTGNMFLSFNNWSSGNTYDVGLGNNTATNGIQGSGGPINPDYTFSLNVGDYSSAVLTVWVVPEPSSFILCGLGAIGLFIAARRRRKAA